MSERVGAYGLHLPDLAITGRLGAAPSTWPDWRLRISIDASIDLSGVAEVIDDERAVIIHNPLGVALVDRVNSETELRLLGAPTAETLVHPLLASTAITANHWMGRPTFHAGAFVYLDRAWGVLGAREDGKSSTLGWMVRAGHEVLTDDILVVEESEVLSGPRCLDLRYEAASHLELGDYLGVIGNRERWRVYLGPIQPSIPLAGWVSLAWATILTIDPVPLAHRLQRLTDAKGMPSSLAGDARTWMDLQALPHFVFARPRDWSQLDEAMTRLLETLANAR